MPAYTYTVPSYNKRRMSKPWIAKVTWKSVEAIMHFGVSSELVAEVEAVEGQILRFGQKDNRNGRHTVSEWAVALPGGRMAPVTEAEARRLRDLKPEERIAAVAA